MKQIHLTALLNTDEVIDSSDCYTDIIVEMSNGNKYAAAAFTYDNIESIRKKNKESGDFLEGKYFWVKNMLLINKCTPEEIKAIVNNLIDEGEFSIVFSKL